MKRVVGDAARPSSISVNCDTDDVIPSHRLQQRPSPSAAVGAFPLPLGRNSTDAVARLLPHQHNEGATAKDETRTASAQSQIPLLPPWPNRVGCRAQKEGQTPHQTLWHHVEAPQPKHKAKRREAGTKTKAPTTNSP
ncbi:hypothetical protein TcCL_ESM11378 [Trypanosoma cruzi]|nr:hypothetical protein TcCL_ESM11378 [Trypanosoma cruzi]